MSSGMAEGPGPSHRASTWMRAFDGVTGGIALLAGFAVAASLSAAIPTLLVWLAIGLMALGIREVAIGIGSPPRTTPFRVLEVSAGIASANLGFLVALFPSFGVATLIWFLFLGLFGFGGAQVGKGIEGAYLPPWFRAYSIGVGMLNLLLIPLLLVAPGRPRITLVLLVSTALVVNGIAIAVSGWVGRRADREPGAWLADSAGRSLK